MSIKKLMVGNWKMNPETIEEARSTFQKIKTKAGKLRNVQTVICAPSIFLGDLSSKTSGHRVVLGAQNCDSQNSGAHTGSISPRQIKSIKAKYVILGHSERRAAGENDEEIAEKVKRAIQEDLIVILCVGESGRDKDGKYLRFIEDQILTDLSKVAKGDLGRVVIAYEPIWAIGIHAIRPAKPSDIFEMKIFIRRVLADKFTKEAALHVPFLYGGSADHQNAREVLEEGHADGLLVGRASNSAAEFGKMLEIAEQCNKKK